MVHKLIDKLKTVAPDVQFDHGNYFCWSPKTQCVIYPSINDTDPSDSWSLLHETAHALLGHNDYKTDLELLVMESEAWDRAVQIGAELGIKIDPDHIQDCLDTYRDWLHKRSTCPTCGVVSLQINATNYRCHNCNTTWSVSSARFCRPYRLKRS